MQPNGKTVQSFEEFTAARKERELAELQELAARAEGKPAPRKRERKPKPAEAKEVSLSDLLLQAIGIVNNRTGRRPQAERIREEVLFDVLQAAIRK